MFGFYQSWKKIMNRIKCIYLINSQFSPSRPHSPPHKLPPPWHTHPEALVNPAQYPPTVIQNMARRKMTAIQGSSRDTLGATRTTCTDRLSLCNHLIRCSYHWQIYKYIIYSAISLLSYITVFISNIHVHIQCPYLYNHVIQCSYQIYMNLIIQCLYLCNHILQCSYQIYMYIYSVYISVIM